MSSQIYILGPCAAESREQVMETARALKARCSVPFIFRAGVWKPRTSPNTFQGAGEEALGWLKEVQQTLGLPVATEVATPEHVEAAMKAGIDYLWIGARTSANPIVVQSLADQLIANSQKPKAIFIKNPVNADAALWIGNIERLEKTGLHVIAIHRGCNHQPCWHMAHTVRTARADIPMLLDPSHMSGDAAQVPTLMQRVQELGLDGAMIEVHNKPSEALSDARQQISPDGLTQTRVLLTDPDEGLADRPASPVRSEIELNWLRAEIDELDDTLWDTIAARMDVSKRIGAWKKAHGVAPLQPERYQHILAQRKAWAQQSGLSAALIEKIFNAIHEESLYFQR